MTVMHIYQYPGKVFVLGKRGFLAQRLAKTSWCKDNKVIYTSTQPEGSDLYLNLEDLSSFDPNLFEKGDLVIFLAAVSYPDLCKNQPEWADRINRLHTCHLIEKALQKQAKVLYFSSDVVLGETQTIQDEKASLNPLGNYAKSKAAVEKEFTQEPGFKVFRLSYVFAKNDKFTSYLTSCLKNDKIVEVFHPFYRSVIYWKDVVDSIIELSYKWEEFDNSIFHLCGPELLSRLNVTEIFQRQVDRELNYKVVTSDEDFFQERARTIETCSLHLQQLLKRPTITIEQAMQLEFS